MVKQKIAGLLLLVLLYTAAPAQTPVVDSLFNALNRSTAEDTSKVTLYYELSRNLKFTDLSKAIEYGEKGIVLSKKLGFDKGTAGCYMAVSTAYIYLDKLDIALAFLDTALQYGHKSGDPNRLGLAYLNRADIYRQLANLSQSLQDCETALSYADKANNDDVRARVNHTIAAVYFQQKAYPQSIAYYDKAIKQYRSIGNMRMSASALNNLGLIYKMMNEFDKAVSSTAAAIHIVDSLGDITNQGIFNGNIAEIYTLAGNYGKATLYANKAMEYALLQKNDVLVAFIRVVMGSIDMKQKQYAEAIDKFNKALVFYRSIEEYDRINTTADILAEAYALAGNHDAAYELMKESKIANDTLTKWRYESDIAAMQTKFKVDEKDKEIQLLAKDKELQHQRLRQQRLLMIASVIVAILALLGISLAVNRYRLKQQMKELQLRNQIAADLHDEVGSSLSSIHMLSQMAAQQENNPGAHQHILARMSNNARETMDKMGDIVWMIKPGENEAGNLKQRMERFAYEIAGSKNITVSMQADELEKAKLSMEQRKNIYLVFKEAINNAVKYSDSGRIDVVASVSNKEITLLIQDYGKGIDNSIVKKGNGVENMQNRAREMGGHLTIDSPAGSGTSVKLTIPG
jgi:two-component system, NarL family, sensor histidine kinase UhpB